MRIDFEPISNEAAIKYASNQHRKRKERKERKELISERSARPRLALAKRRAPELARAILGRGEYFAQDAGHRLYYYADGAYRKGGDEHVRRLIKAMVGDYEWTRRLAEETVEYIRVDSLPLWERPSQDAVNVKNGIVNVDSKELRPADPSFLSTVQLPVVFDPKATCPEWERQVQETFPDDAVKAGVAWEIAGWLMMPDARIQKALLLIGEGGTGKSTFLTALTRFLGEDNVSNLSLQKLEMNRFAASRLVGKLANICADLPSTHLQTSSTFKAITGGDRISAEYKFGQIFEFTAFARLVFSTNQPPRSSDASGAFYERWLVLPFDRVFRGRGGEVDRENLDASLATPRELSGLLNQALTALPKVKERRLTETPSMRKAAEQFRAVTDPVAIWLNQNTATDAHAVTPKELLFQAFNLDAEREGRPPITDTAFFTAFNQHRPTIEEKQRTIGGQVKRCKLGIVLKRT